MRSALVFSLLVLSPRLDAASYKRALMPDLAGEWRSLSGMRHYVVDGKAVLAAEAPAGGLAIDASAKLSDALADSSGYFLIELHPDVARTAGEALAVSAGLVLHHHPDLLRRHLLVSGAASSVRSLASWDEIAYVFPASDALSSGMPVTACAGPVTKNGTIAQYVATVGEGWDGAGRNAAALTYSFAQYTNKLSREVIQSEAARALAEWSRVAKISFTLSATAGGSRNLNFLFAQGDHGDPYAFDGTGKILAHTYYPPPNPEPIAGDLHLDSDENWQVGVDMDLFSVVLHEAGHALGLGHADTPAAVMYPYYRKVTSLNVPDVEAIHALYAASDGAASQLSLEVVKPPASVAAAVLDMQGTAQGGSGAIRVGWRTVGGAAGSAEGSGAWAARSIPLVPGQNFITITAGDAAGSVVAKSFPVTRTAPVTTPEPPQPGPPKPAPTPPTPAPAPPTPAPAPAPAPAPEPTNPGGDRTAPSLRITSPAGTSVATTASRIRVQGTASDNVGVTEVSWTSSEGEMGKAEGTEVWSAEVPLFTGGNTITVRARDAAGNTGWRTVVVTRR